MKRLLQTLLCVALATTVSAQLSTNPDKFLGNITTQGNVDAGGGIPVFSKLWNQITCENESKWASVEGTRNSYNWGCDRAFNYAKQHHFTYKFHALVWGAQYPSWIENLSYEERQAAIVKWFDAVKKKYNHLPMIDVVNEAIEGHQAGTHFMKEALGGGGKTGYDWLIKAFEMAYERFPNSILIYNDFNTFQWNTDQFIDLVRSLRDAGAPIDAYGCQSHDLTDCSFNNFTTAEKKIQDALKMPMYSTEYDIGTEDDKLQEQRYKEQIPYMWEKDYCAGITLWGYVYGKTWTTNGNSGIYKNGKERPAMTWLKEYMASEQAQKAKSPYPGMKKRLSVFIKPRELKVAKGDVLPIKVRTHITDSARAEKAGIAIDKVELFDGSKLIATMTEEPYIAEYAVPTNAATGWKTLRAVVSTNDGNTYVRYGRINILASTTKREPYREIVPELPGTIVTTEYDKGAAGVSYSDASRSATTATKDNGWMEYTVDVKEDGIYSFDAEVAASKSGGMFHLSEYTFDNLNFLSEFITVPMTGGNTSFQTVHSVLKMPLTAGRHVICLNIDKGGFYMKSLTFSRYEEDKNMNVTTTLKPVTVTVGDKTTVTVTAKSTTSTIASVAVYANNLLLGTLTEAPYTVDFIPTAKGSYSIVAIATDANGKEKQSAVKTLKVNGRRVPYAPTVISVPGTIQAEYYDQGGEGLTYHDTDEDHQGDANFRISDGVDIVNGNGGRAIGYTAANEWIEYSVNVKEAGKYSCTATVSSGVTGSGFTLGLVKGSTVTSLCKIDVPQTGNNNWDTYKTVTATLNRNLDAGNQILRITINGANCNIDKLVLKLVESTGIDDVSASPLVGHRQYNLSGQRVSDAYHGIILMNGRKIHRK